MTTVKNIIKANYSSKFDLNNYEIKIKAMTTKQKRLINMENRGFLEGLWKGGWAQWGRGTKESTPEIIVAPYSN